MSEWYERKIGPLPLGAWAVIGGAGLGLIVLLQKRQSKNTVPQLDVAPADSLASITRVSPGYIPTPIPIYPANNSNGGIGGGDATGFVSPDISQADKVKAAQERTKNDNSGPFKPNAPIPTAPKSPVVTPTPPPANAAVKHYPGLPDNYVLNCSASFKGLHGDWNTVLATQEAKHQNGTFTERNMAAIGAYGTPTPWLGRGDWNNPISINLRRVRNGLYPLTDTEMQQLFDDIETLSGHGTTDINKHARELFEKWNRPYQCSAGNTFRRVG